MHLSLHNAANSDLSLPSSLIAASSDPLRQKSYQQRSFAAICLHRSPQQSFAANCLDRGQHRNEHNQQRSLAPYHRCPPLQQPCTPLPRLPPIAAASLLQPTPPAATKLHRSRSQPKLEAFETRMDARLRALFEEFRLGRSPSPRRSQHGANSDCKKNPLEIRSEVKTRQPYTSVTSIFFAQLQEGYLNQDAQSMRATSQPKAYKPSASINYKNLDEELAMIRQTSTIQEYQNRFERLSNQTYDWSEKQILRIFIEGLKPDIEKNLKHDNHTHLRQSSPSHDIKRSD
ncbi:hypothetical protein B296_00016120 [Ensete ventricosum]|uniref:Retrotransposon gag domain-containing protein n=1 Tax=Ensete ventricosum TaxID=4639 RepID=A0A426Z3N6_ENSVE|nr:hypothetical protein B296_00016120 [Ensete ventricosum]